MDVLDPLEIVKEIINTPPTEPPKEEVKEVEIELSEEQKLKLLEFWNSKFDSPPSLKECVSLIFPDKEPRDKWGRTVRKFLATRKLKPVLAQDYLKKEKVEFTSEQKEFLLKNGHLKKPWELAKELFGPDVPPADIRVRCIVKFLNETPNNALFHIKQLERVTGEYSPPNTLEKLVPKVNEYANPEKRLEEKTLTPKQKKELLALIGYLHTKRFLFQALTYEKEQDRILFEYCIVKWTYDKGDLTQEDLDQYIMLATDVVSSQQMSRSIALMQKQQDELVDNGEKMSMTLVEAIQVARKEYNDNSKRQSELLKALTQKRSDRMSKLVKENATILNLVSFVKEQENRRKLIEFNKMKEEKLKDEIKKYIDMSELKARFLGIGPDEIING